MLPKMGSKVDVSDGIFKDIKYYVIGNIDLKILDMLVQGGGKQDHYLSEMISVAIAEDTDEDDYCEAKELFEIPIVTSKWILMSVKCGNVLPYAGFSPEMKQVFDGVVACPTKMSQRDSCTIWSLITFYGGNCQRKLDPSVTHLVAHKPTGMKYDIATRHSNKVKIVSPDWILHCVEQNSKLDERRYHPHLIQDVDEHPMDAEQKERLTPDAVLGSPSPGLGPPILLQGSPKGDGSKTKEALAKMVNSRIKQATAKFRETMLDYAPPVEAEFSPEPSPQILSPGAQILPVGSPLGSMLPVNLPSMPTQGRGRGRGPRGGRGSRGGRGGSPRGMLKNITNSGESTLTRSPRNSRSPRSPRGSPKGGRKIKQLMQGLSNFAGHQPYMGGVPMVGPPPLHEMPIYFGHDISESIPADLCLLGCVFYITDYQKLVTDEQLTQWKQLISDNGGQVDDSYSNRVTHVLCEHQKSDVFHLALRDGKRLVTAYWLNDVIVRRKLCPPWMALHIPLVYGKDRPLVLKDQMFCVSNFDGEERMRVKQMIVVLGAKYTGYMTRAHSALIAKRPTGRKYEKAVEWRLPVLNINFLNDLLLGNTRALKLPVNSRYQTFTVEDLFCVEPWRISHLMDGWKVPIKISKEAWKRVTPNIILKLPKSAGTESQSQLSRSLSPAHSVHPVTPGTHTRVQPGSPAHPADPAWPGSTAHFGLPMHSAAQPIISGNSPKSGFGSGPVMAAQSGHHLPPGQRDLSSVYGQTPTASHHLHEVHAAGDVVSQKRTADYAENPHLKKPKLEPRSDPSPPQVLFTGIPPDKLNELSQAVVGLEGSVVEAASHATHLVCDHIARTVKFLCAVSTVEHIVNVEWVKQSQKCGHFLNEANFALSDSANESKFQVSLPQSLNRAQQRRVFGGLQFYVTPGVVPGLSTLAPIIKCAGGQVLRKQPTRREIRLHQNDKGETKHVIISCREDLHLVRDLAVRRIVDRNMT